MSEARQVTTRQAAELAEGPPEGSPMMEMIYRAASNPNMAVETFERYVALIRDVKADEARQAFSAAMNACQAEMGPVAADAENPQTHSKYASYPALDKAVRPIYSRHGFSLSFGTAEGAPNDHVRLVCHVAHASGHAVDHHLDMPADGKGARGGDVMTKTHATGAALSYGQRYLLKLIFNIAVGEDTDGNSNGGREMGDAARRAVADINACATGADLVLWQKNTFPGVENIVSAPERKEIVALWNRRAKALKEEAANG